MNRRVFLAGAFSAACGRGRPRLNVYNWSDYVAPDTVSNFEYEFGVDVRYGTYEGNQEMIAKVMSGNSGWDVVFPSADMNQPMREMGLLQPLNHAWLPNLDSLDRAFQTPQWDRELRWSIPYMHGTTGIVYQKSFAAAPEAWADMWSERLRGKITMLDDPQEVIGICLKKIGFSVNSGDPQELRAAQAQAVAQKPLLRAYLNAEVRDQLVAGDVTAAQAWAVTAGQAIAAAPDKLAFSLPKEGFPRYADTMAILRESRRSELAHRFMLPASPGGGRRDRSCDADLDRERGCPKSFARGTAGESCPVPASGSSGAGRVVRASLVRGATVAGSFVDGNQKRMNITRAKRSAARNGS